MARTIRRLVPGDGAISIKKMRPLVLLAVLAWPVAAAPQGTRTYTPDTPARADETTIVNTSVVRVDGPGRTITVRSDAGADGTVDRTRTRTLAVAPAAAAALARLKAGSAVLLTLRGDTVFDIKLSTGGASSGAPATGRATPSAAPRGTSGATGGTTAPGRVITVSPAPATRSGRPQEIPQLPPGATTPTNRGIPQLPAGDSPQGRAIPQVVPRGGVVVTRTPSPGISPAGVSPRPAISPVGVQPRPAISPVSGPSPRSPGTPRPVVLPSDPPPTPIPPG